MSISLDDLAAALTGPHQFDLYQHIHTIYGDKSRFRADSRFLSKFPELRYFDGSTLLVVPEDFEVYQYLDFKTLKLDLNHQISNSKVLVPICRKGKLSLFNLDQGHDLYVSIDHDTINFQHKNLSKLVSHAEVIPWLPLLEQVTVLDTHNLSVDILNDLPANIETLLISSYPEGLKPRYPVRVEFFGFGYETLANDCDFIPKIHPKIKNLMIPLPSNPMPNNPHLAGIGIDFSRCQDLSWLQDHPELELKIWVRDFEEKEYVRSLTRNRIPPVTILKL